MSEDKAPSFPAYHPPYTPAPDFAHTKQSAPLMKIMKHMLKMPKRKVLQRRNKPVTKKKYIIR